jgi:hypothetical protein
MPRSNTVLSIGAALALSIAGASLSAQDSPYEKQDLAGMAPMVVTARKMSGNELRRDNFRLRRELALYDRRIAYLEKRLHHLKTVVTDSLQRDITSLHSAADSTRTRRLRLESQLAEVEARANRAHVMTYR